MLDFASPMVVSLLLAAAAGAAPATDAESNISIQLAQVTIERRVIIRIPAVRSPRRAVLNPPASPALDELPELKEVKGPKCLKVERLRGAVINTTRGVTMVTDGEERFRAHFSRMCRPADFYSGFYIEPNKDGSICAGRDALYARNGSACDIEKFSRLVPDN